MAGKRGLIMGVANDRSIAWGIARTLAAHGAELAFTYQGAAFAKRVIRSPKASAPRSRPTATSPPTPASTGCSRRSPRRGAVSTSSSTPSPFSDREQLKGRYADTTRDNFLRTLDISCYSFTSVARRAADLMAQGGSLVTLTYGGAERWMAAFTTSWGWPRRRSKPSVRYLAADPGRRAIRVNAISAGPCQDAGGLGHRRFPLHPEMERAQTRRSPATSPSTRSAGRRSTSPATCRRRCPARCTTSTAATTSWA